MKAVLCIFKIIWFEIIGVARGGKRGHGPQKV